MILLDAGREPHRTGSFAGGVDTAGEGLLDVFQELRLGGSGVSQHQNIDVPSDLVLAVLCLFALAAEHGQRKACLYMVVAIDAWGDRVYYLLCYAWLSAQ